MAGGFRIAVAFVMMAVASMVLADSRARISGKERQRILDLISAYSYAYDGQDIEGFLVLLTKDCVWEAYASGDTTPIVRTATGEELRTVVTQRFTMLKQKGIQSRHYQTNTLLVPRPDGQVEGTTMLNLTWQVPGEKPYTVTTGVYRDLFVKSAGDWKFAKRSLFMDQGSFGK